jgi:hypothetical protein
VNLHGSSSDTFSTNAIESNIDHEHSLLNSDLGKSPGDTYILQKWQ